MNRLRTMFVLVCLMGLTLLAGSCSMLNPAPPSDLPPILSQDELIRPYVKLGRIQVTREVYGIVDTNLTPAIREWGFTAVRAEAAKMGADAVILPEVSGHTVTYLVMPTTEYRASGIAIRFK
jgi:hypothetical protein